MIQSLKPRALWLAVITYVVCALQVHASTTEQVNSDPEIIITRHCGQSITPGNAHIEKLIYLAFSKFDLKPIFNNVNQYCSHSREVKFLQEGKSDILWATTTADYEQQLIPIRIPIYKGLLGYRIALIRAEDKGKFAHITTLEQLQTLRFGQGEGWADTAILKEAGLKVTESSDVHNLFNMLRAGRFDLFPRGLMEPWEEVKQLPAMNFAVEEHILIAYPLPAYIFVSPKRPELAELIHTGLELAIQDGSFDQLVMADPNVQQALRLANIKQRKIFYLENSKLTKETPLSNKALWVNLN